MNENIINRMYEYIEKAFIEVKPIYAFIASIISYVVFPDKAYFLALMAVLGASFADIVTKIYSIIKKHGGYKKAIQSGHLFSKSLWKGTEVKIVSYLTISILTGLSYRVIYLKEAGIFLASFVYSVMFMREFQSNIENLMEAGADVQWLLLFSKKKNKELMKLYEEEQIKKEVNDYEQRI
ncbi:hypothetical protein EV204_105185 [Tissierella praeacuta]|uniref:hypothetical protein n=1 Tax=Tissierella praeacuta TaxID=43131 RepID=UPI00104A54D9|nr:hypothetical protein [Tissierella praeacuta]TCU72849.1 hypothetical protein EV204_105185 [Tissierella praeacuta]